MRVWQADRSIESANTHYSGRAWHQAEFGVLPESIPDYLALVGDAADGYPGLRGWGAKSSTAVLAKFLHLERIPRDYTQWQANVANAATLANTLVRDWESALLFRKLATLRTGIRLFDDVDQLRWHGPTAAFDETARRLDAAQTERRGTPKARKANAAQVEDRRTVIR